MMTMLTTESFPLCVLAARGACGTFTRRHLPLVYAYSDQALDLETTLREKMQQLSGEEFEGVLHPVFQEDELTLILVGAFLGLLAGFGQAVFF